MLAVGLDKLCPQASLASMPFGGPYVAKSLLQGTWRPLWPSWSPLRCVLGALGGVLEACRGVWEALGHPLGHLGVVLDASWGLLGPSRWHLGRSWSRLGGVIGALGAIREASWALLEPFERRLGALGAVWEASWAPWAVCCRYAEFHRVFDVFH